MTDIGPTPQLKTDHARVAPTAWGVAYLRTFTDIPLASEFFDALNTNLQEQGEPDIATTSFRDHLAPQLEARYKLVDRLVMATGATQILELAAGIATHGINLTRANPDISYVEVDLPGVIKEKQAIIQSTGIPVPEYLAMREGDALSESDLQKAAADFSTDKPLTVINEGLMRYLTFDQKATLARSIHGLLNEHGGAWVTPDISLKQALSREDEVSAGHISKLKKTTGINVDQNVFEDQEHAQQFFEDLGFNVEPHSFLEVSDQLVSPDRLGMSDDDVRRLNEPCVAFVMTLKS